MLDPDLLQNVDSLCTALETSIQLLRTPTLTHTQLYQTVDAVLDCGHVLKKISDEQCERDLKTLSENLD